MVKTITIREEVYTALTKVKKKDESFSELLDKLLKSTSSIGLLTKVNYPSLAEGASAASVCLGLLASTEMLAFTCGILFM